MLLCVGNKVPSFELPMYSEAGLSQKLVNKNVVLYFYSKDLTAGCTTQATDFNDRINSFELLQTTVLGVSRDSRHRHQTFKVKYNLNLQLLADEDGALCKAYGVWQLKKFMGREFMGIARTTFLIDHLGVIRKVWPKVKVKGHAETVLNAVYNLQA